MDRTRTPATGPIVHDSRHRIAPAVRGRATSTTGAALLLLFLSFLQWTPAKAQFFKDLLNNVKQTVQNRANGKANQSTNSVLNKVDSATKFGSGSASGGGSASGSAANHGATGITPGSIPSGSTLSLPGGIDTSGMGRVLGAFAQAAAANPNDTSAGDVTMKALGLLTGGGGVSPADSAAAINSFKTAGGGPGILYQTVTTVTSSRGTSKDTSSAWFTNAGFARSEMSINMGPVSSGKIISIQHASNAKYSILLDPDKKTYSLNIIDTSLINGGGEKYQVTVIGHETVSGYPAVHSKLTSTIGSGMFKSTTTMDLWTSTALPGYALLKTMMSSQNIKPKMLQALETAGAGGWMVKMQAGSKDYTMTMQFLRAEEKTFPASLFEIPSGYTEENQNMARHLMSGAAKKQ